MIHGFRGCVLLDLLSLACNEAVHPSRVLGKGVSLLVSRKEKEGGLSAPGMPAVPLQLQEWLQETLGH